MHGSNHGSYRDYPTPCSRQLSLSESEKSVLATVQWFPQSSPTRRIVSFRRTFLSHSQQSRWNMGMIRQLHKCIILLTGLASLTYHVTTAREISRKLEPCDATCDVSCTKDRCKANCDDRVNYVPNACHPVEELTINDNVIHSINDTTFREFTRLTMLSMANNGISSITDDGFNRTKLTSIDLSGNAIGMLSGRIFGRLVNLTKLKLGGNRLEIVMLQGLSKLQHLDLSDNRISRITHENFTQTNLTYLDLSLNRITELENDCLGKLTNLGTLILSGNRIGTVDSNAFHFLQSLGILRLDSNELDGTFNVGGNVFEEQHKLKELNLSNNRLTHLSEEMFQFVRPAIEKLIIQENLISDVSRDTFQLMAKISEIDLQGNRIGTKSRNAFLMLLEEKRDVTIKLGRNTICEAYVAEFKDYYGKGISCLPNQTEAYSGMGRVYTTPGMPITPDSVTSPEGPVTLKIVLIVAGSVIGGLIILLLVARVRARIRRGNSGVTNRGYNLPQHQHLEHHQIPMLDVPSPPVPPRNPTMSSGPYMNGTQTFESNSTQSYIQPSPATPNRGTCSRHHNRTCQRHNLHPLPPRPDRCKTSPNLRSEPGSIVIVGTTHGGTGKAHMTGLPKPKRQWRRSLTRHLPSHMPGHYLARRETKEGRPDNPGNNEVASQYMTRHETIDGRPKHDTMGTATYKSVHS